MANEVDVELVDSVLTEFETIINTSPGLQRQDSFSLDTLITILEQNEEEQGDNAVQEQTNENNEGVSADDASERERHSSLERGEMTAETVNAVDELPAQHGVSSENRVQIEKFHNIKLLQEKIEIPTVLHAHYIGETRQPAEERDSAANISSIYEFVSTKLNYWTIREEHFPNVADEHEIQKEDIKYILIKWCIELWFIKVLGSCVNNEVQDWLAHCKPEELFERYFAPVDNSEARYNLIVKEDACDLLRELIKTDLMKGKLEQYLNQLQNLRKLTEEEISEEIKSILGPQSHKYYVIPKKSSDQKMYGMHFYLTNFTKVNEYGYAEPDEAAIDHADEEAQMICKALLSCGFSVLQPTWEQFRPECGTFTQIEHWLRKTLCRIQNKCSLLFISFSTHGIQAHLRDYEEELTEIQTILKWINEFDKMRTIPKVMVVQACQIVECSDGETEEKARQRYEDISNRLEQYVQEQTTDMMLLMSAERGAYYECGISQSYLIKFAEAMHVRDSLEEFHCLGHENNEERAAKTSLKSDGVKELHLLHRPIEPPMSDASNETNSVGSEDEREESTRLSENETREDDIEEINEDY